MLQQIVENEARSRGALPADKYISARASSLILQHLGDDMHAHLYFFCLRDKNHYPQRSLGE